MFAVASNDQELSQLNLPSTSIFENQRNSTSDSWFLLREREERENFIKILNWESKLAPGGADKMKVTDILIERHDFIISPSEGDNITAAAPDWLSVTDASNLKF